MSDNALGIIYFIACSHAIMLAVSLWLKTSASSPARLLSILAALIAYKLYEGGALYSGLYSQLAHTMDLLPAEVLTFGPLYYLYISNVSGNRGVTLPKCALHFIPAATLWLYNSPSVFRSAESKIAMWDNVLASSEAGPIAIQWVILLLAIKAHLATYLYLSWSRVRTFEEAVDKLRADDSHLVLSKMRITILAFFMLEVVWVTLFLGQQFLALGTLNLVSEVWLLFVAVMVLALGFIGLQRPKFIFDQEERTLAEASLTDLQSSTNTVPLQHENVKYMHSSLPESSLSALAQELEIKLKEQQLYLDDSLSITELSKATGIRSHTLSQVINQYMNTNFYKLINSYRVQHAVALIEDPQVN